MAWFSLSSEGQVDRYRRDYAVDGTMCKGATALEKPCGDGGFDMMRQSLRPVEHSSRNMRLRALFTITGVILSATLIGCDAVHKPQGAASAGEAESGSETFMATPVTPLVFLIGGIDSDPTPEQIAGTAARGEGNSGPFQLRGDLLADGYAAEYFNWNGTRAGEIESEPAPLAGGIARSIRERHADTPDAPIVIVGNSWGGHTAWEVCGLLSDEPAIEVELVVFLDPSSLARASTIRPDSLPECVQSAATYFTRNAGGWGAWEGEPRIENIDLGDPANGFLIPGGPAYDATFSIQAHIAAEWDERIHGDIRARIDRACAIESAPAAQAD
jgi:hypothetical protein